MSYWYSHVVARTSGSLLDLVTVQEYSEGLVSEARWGPWREGEFPGGDLESVAPAFQQALAAETGAPALTAFVLGGDAALVEAAHPDGRWWRACLARSAGFWDEEEFRQSGLDVEANTEHAVAWAVETGLQPDPDALRALFAEEHWPMYQSLVQRLVDGLGVSATIGDDSPPSLAPRPVRVRRRRHPLDCLLDEHVAPVLEAAGCIRHGRRFRRRRSAGGDDVVLAFGSTSALIGGTVAFRMSVQITTAAKREDWLRFHPQYGAEDFLNCGGTRHLPLPVPTPPDGPRVRQGVDPNFWEMDHRDEAAVAMLVRAVVEQAIPQLADGAPRPDVSPFGLL